MILSTQGTKKNKKYIQYIQYIQYLFPKHVDGCLRNQLETCDSMVKRKHLKSKENFEIKKKMGWLGCIRPLYTLTWPLNTLTQNKLTYQIWAN